MSDPRKTVGRVVSEIGCGHGAGCSSALVTRNIGLLTKCVMAHSKMFRRDSVTSALALLDDVGESVQCVITAAFLRSLKFQ